MRPVAYPSFVLGFIAVLAAVSGCCFRVSTGTGAHPAPVRAHGYGGKLTVAVDEDSVKEYGPVEIHIDARFYGHLVETTEYDLRPGTHWLRLERRSLPTYSAMVNVSREIPVLIVAPSEPQ